MGVLGVSSVGYQGEMLPSKSQIILSHKIANLKINFYCEAHSSGRVDATQIMAYTPRELPENGCYEEWDGID